MSELNNPQGAEQPYTFDHRPLPPDPRYDNVVGGSPLNPTRPSSQEPRLQSAPKFMKADDGTAFNVAQIVAVGPANVMRKSRGFGRYLMVELSDGRTAVPLYGDTKNVWPEDALDEFLRVVT